MLKNLTPKEAHFKVTLMDGREVELTLRPFTLGDKGWMENNFSTEDDKISIAEMHAIPWSKILWHQMNKDSRDIFMRIKFIKVDEETNKDIDADPEGYERFMEGLFAVEDLLSGIEAFSKCRGDNDYQDDGSLKKKTK